jgi:indolepyruvate ferredoxin oxidoreductase
MLAKRVSYLSSYQNRAYAQKYMDLVDRMRAVDTKMANETAGLTAAAARYYHKVLAYKDEYEVARLYTDGAFIKALGKQFSGKYKIKFHMAPPIFEKQDPATGRPAKREFGPAMFFVLRVLAKLKSLRGTPFDIFSYNSERKMERELIGEYESIAELVIKNVNADNYQICVELLSFPEIVKGYGPVKEQNVKNARQHIANLKEQILHGHNGDENQQKAA